MVSFKAFLLIAVIFSVSSLVSGFRPGSNPLLPDTGTAQHGGVDPRILNLPSVPTHDPATGPVNPAAGGGTTGGGTTGGGATGGGSTGGGSAGGGATGGTTSGGNHALPRGPRPGK